MYGIIMCPPVRTYPAPPKDQPGCELTICPHCSREAWVSAKKRSLMANLERYELYCYDCAIDEAVANPLKIANSMRVNI